MHFIVIGEPVVSSQAGADFDSGDQRRDLETSIRVGSAVKEAVPASLDVELPIVDAAGDFHVGERHAVIVE
jgi:hypothetical protein